MMKMDWDMKIIYSSFDNHSPRDLALTNEGWKVKKGLLPKNWKNIIVPIGNSFQKNTQYVDIMLKKRRKKEALLVKFLQKSVQSTPQMKIFQSWC